MRTICLDGAFAASNIAELSYRVCLVAGCSVQCPDNAELRADCKHAVDSPFDVYPVSDLSALRHADIAR